MEDIDWGWILSAALAAFGIGASAAWGWFRKSAQWNALDKRTRIVLTLVAAAVQYVYKHYVRPQKEANPDNKLTTVQRDKAMSEATKLVKAKAKDFGVANHPILNDEKLLQGVIQETVREAKGESSSKRLRAITGPGRPRPRTDS